MHHLLHIVATCTDTKSASVDEALRMRNVARGTVAARAHAWHALLGSTESVRLPAEALYSGVLWSNIRALVRDAGALGYRTIPWVASAGHGLVPFDRPIPPYAATFSGRHEDAVSRNVTDDLNALRINRAWWNELAAAPNAFSISTLASQSSRASILVFGSPEYIAAMADDLIEARQRLETASRLVVVTTRKGIRNEQLAPALVEHDARLTHHVGKPVTLLHVRASRLLLEEARGTPLDAPTARTQISDILSRTPEFSWPQREAMSDEAVVTFIRRAIDGSGKQSASPLLRQLRSTGYACEQKRFKALFALASKEIR